MAYRLRKDEAVSDGLRRVVIKESTAAIEQLWHLAYREASTLAFADAFRASMVAFILATLLVPLLRKVGAVRPAVSKSH